MACSCSQGSYWAWKSLAGTVVINQGLENQDFLRGMEGAGIISLWVKCRTSTGVY